MKRTYRKIATKIVRFFLWLFDKKVLRYINHGIDYSYVDSYVQIKSIYIVDHDYITRDILITWEQYIEEMIKHPTA